MSISPLTPLEGERPRGPLLFVVLDGVGIGCGDTFDAVAHADMPVFRRLLDGPRYRTVAAHGKAVGMPSDSDMGNSEVGHNAIGAGRVVRQGAALVDDALASETLFKSAGFAAVNAACKAGGTLHLIGLLSDGGVHSRIDQLEALTAGAASRGVAKIRLHMLTDGRDVPDQSATQYIAQIEAHFAALDDKYGVDACIASGGGRMGVTMDRYEGDWAIVERGYRAHVHGEGEGFASARAAVEAFRAREPGVSDQNLPAFVVHDNSGEPVGRMHDGDAVVTFNFRGDRMIEIASALERAAFSNFDRTAQDGRPRPALTFAGMMEYDGDTKLPALTLVAPPAIAETSGEFLVATGLRTFALSETHKYGHVTYFWNGNRSEAFDSDLEVYEEIASLPGGCDENPNMQAAAIAARSAEMLCSKQFDLVRINIANGDMVGHTGSLEATREALAHTDKALGVLLDAVQAVGGVFLVTADHGNADDMALRDKSGAPLRDGDGHIRPRTSHTLAPVPVCIGGPGLPASWSLSPSPDDAGLANLTATFMMLMGYTPPQNTRLRSSRAGVADGNQDSASGVVSHRTTP